MIIVCYNITQPFDANITTKIELEIMTKFPIPENEAVRLNALKEYNILDTNNEAEFDRLVKLASLICEVPIALVSLVDEDRQWFKARVGLDAEQTPRDISFCQYAIMTHDLFEVEDTTQDERFKDNPLVTGAPHIKFYAGYPLKDPQGVNLGTLCTIDRVPKKLDKNKSLALKLLAEEVVSQIVARRNNLENKKLERLFTLSIDMICVVGIDGFFKRVNPAFTNILGWTEQELLSSPLLNFVYNEDVSLTQKEIGKLAEGKQTDFITRFIRKDGGVIHLRWVANSYPATGEIFAIARDITYNLKQIDKIKEAKEIAEKALKVKDEFLANMSHEIRTPLNAIIGFNNLLSETPLNKTQKEYVETVINASQNLMVIINDVLDTSRLESGKLKLEQKPINIKQIAEKVIKLHSNSAKSKGLKLMLSVDFEIPNNVIGDETRLIQILVNLISNAIKFTENGRVELQVLLEATSLGKAEILFVVKDTGIGIDKMKIDTIFERFTQAESSTTRLYGGTGLGLNIVKMLVGLFKGKLDVQSELNKGTEFSFLIPFTISEEKAETTVKKTEKGVYGIDNIKVLLVEDNEHNQILASTYLKKNNATVEIAINGKIAVDLLQTKQFDVIIMDLHIPIMDGYKATSLIRNELKLNTPIIACSARSLDGEKEKCLEIGMNDYISKPFTEKELIGTISEYVTVPDISEKNLNEKTSVTITNDQLDDFHTILVDLENKEGKEFLLAMMTVYLKRIPNNIKELENDLEESNLSSIEQKAHLLAGSLSSVSFNYGESLAKKLEKAAASQKTDEVEMLTKQLIDYLKQSIPTIKKYCQFSKIVIIEDDEMLRLSLTYYLKSTGIQIIEFDNGADGIAYIQKEHEDIDLVITDLNLPFADGQQVIMAIKAIENVRIKIIVLTSSGVESSELESFKLGADDFITKPFSLAVMKTRINKLLEMNV